MNEYQAQCKFNGRWAAICKWHEDLDYARDALKSWLTIHHGSESRMCMCVTIVLENY